MKGRRMSAIVTASMMAAASLTTMSQPAMADEEKTIINIWSKDRHDAEYVQKKVDEYNATNTDNIEVNYQLYTDNYQQAIDALTSFFAYEKFALHTPHSHIHHPNYKAMMELLFYYLEPEFRVPMLNDTNYGHTSSIYYLYEFAYREIGGEKLLYVLRELYKNEERNNLEAFIYGVDELPECNIEPTENHIEKGSGNSILRGNNQRYLLLKHDCYGGEHDHYDRLDISYEAFGKRISPDLGTTG